MVVTIICSENMLVGETACMTNVEWYCTGVIVIGTASIPATAIDEEN